MSVAMQYSDILSLMEYIQLIEKCSTPKAGVELFEDVMDVKHLFNPSPSENAAFPVGTSRCHRTRGVCTKSVQPGREWYMDPTSPLHRWVRRDADAKVVVMTRTGPRHSTRGHKKHLGYKIDQSWKGSLVWRPLISQ